MNLVGYMYFIQNDRDENLRSPSWMYRVALLASAGVAAMAVYDWVSMYQGGLKLAERWRSPIPFSGVVLFGFDIGLQGVSS